MAMYKQHNIYDYMYMIVFVFFPNIFILVHI